MKATAPRSPPAGMLLAAFACILVGASFTANGVLGDYPYAGGQAIRYGIACLPLLPLVALGRVREVPSGPRPLARHLATLSESPKYAQYESDPPPCDAPHQTPQAPPCGRTALLRGHAPGATAPLRALTRRQWGRLAVGAFTVQGWGRTDAAGLAWSVAALVGEVGFAVLAVPVLRPLGPGLLSATVAGVAAIESTIAGLVLDGDRFVRMPTGEEALALGWQAAVVTVIGFICWYMGMQRIGAERATLFSGLIPVAAALTAPLVDTGA